MLDAAFVAGAVVVIATNPTDTALRIAERTVAILVALAAFHVGADAFLAGFARRALIIHDAVRRKTDAIETLLANTAVRIGQTTIGRRAGAAT